MPNDLQALGIAGRSRLGWVGTAVRLGLIGVVVAAVVGAFAYLGGWFSPNELTPSRFTDAFEQADGVHPGFRRNHAKGVGVTGYFESNGQGVRLSKALVFQPGRVPVLGRFSLSGGRPDATDTPESVRGLALQFTLPNGELWRTAMINLPVFPVRTPEAFYERLVAARPDPETGKPDPARMQAFLDRHPETIGALRRIKNEPFSSGFDNSTFRGLNAFRFVDSAGISTPVRWLLAPEQPFEAASATPASHDKSYLFDGLISQLRRRPLRWHLVAIVGQPGDPTDDASVAWPDDRERVDVGTVTLDRVETEENGVAKDINFDPLVLPAGIEPSDDPLLSARSAVYSRSFTRRAGETKSPNENGPAEARKGE